MSLTQANKVVPTAVSSKYDRDYVDIWLRRRAYYMRKHNPLVSYDSVGIHATRAARIRNFNDFAVNDRLSIVLLWSPTYITSALIFSVACPFVIAAWS